MRQRPRYCLVVADRRVELAPGESVVGRHPSADILIDSTGASRRHVRLRLDDSGLWAEDLGSANGTFVNGQRITSPVLLASGDAIGVGADVLAVAVMPAGESTPIDGTPVRAHASAHTAETTTYATSVAYVEALIANDGGGRKKEHLLTIVKPALDAAILTIEKNANAKEAAERLTSVVEHVESWSPANDHAQWIAQRRERLRRLMRGD